uniref:RCC1-like domain-containing protein n=1 Tax=Glossina morsitans morsitans TaxID=37546 RepID=A0A1B0FK39_GLOMM
MSRIGERRKATITNNAGENDEPKRKMQRVVFQLPLPERPRVTGRVLVCGQGDMGQLGLGDDSSKFERKRPTLVEKVLNVVDVTAGGMHNLLLTLEGHVYSFGCNDEGALGRDSSEEGSEFVPHAIDLPNKVLKISAGDSHSACLLEDGRVFAWGSFRDSHGNMGLTLEGNKRLPIEVLPGTICCDIASGADHLVILSCAGKVYTIGCGEQGQLGRVSLRSASGEGRRGKTELLKPGQVVIKYAKFIETIWATTYCTFLKETSSGNIWAFGLNNYKQLAYPKDISPVISPISMNLDRVLQIAGGQHHTMLLKHGGTVEVIGRKDYGRLGLGPVKEDVIKLTPISALARKGIVQISCGEAQSFALTNDGKLYAWGMGSNHQLGTGSEEDALVPTLIESKQAEGKRIIKVSSGGQHTIFLAEDEIQFDNASSGKSGVNKKTNDVAVKKSKDAKNSKRTAKREEENNATDRAAEGMPTSSNKSLTEGQKKAITPEEESPADNVPPPVKRGRTKRKT